MVNKPIVNYKLLVIIPILLLIFSVATLVLTYTQTGEWFERNIELKGGNLIELGVPEPVDTAAIEEKLSAKFGSVSVRQLRTLDGFQISIQTSSNQTDLVLDELQSLGLDVKNPSIKTIGSSLGSSFWGQVQLGIIIAFIMMGIVVFIIFRTLVPSFAVILAAVSDILVTLAMMQIFGIELSLASFAALLMLIGYSVDTDIMLTTRLLKSTEGLNLTERIKNALKTGLTMTLTSMGALISLLILGISPVLSQIAMVLVIGLSIDLVHTWLQNSVIIRWYMERRGEV